MALVDNLPKFTIEDRYINEILEAIQPEIDNLKIRLSEILLECCVSTCTEIGMSLYEQDYNIKLTQGLSLDERKTQVINKMLSKKVLTYDALYQLIKRNIDSEEFYISNFAEKYGFKIMLYDESYREKLYKALKYAKPAHLVFEISLIYYEKRCGTFNSGQMYP